MKYRLDPSSVYHVFPQRLLTFNPDRRITAEQSLTHSYFQDDDDDDDDEEEDEEDDDDIDEGVDVGDDSSQSMASFSQATDDSGTHSQLSQSQSQPTGESATPSSMPERWMVNAPLTL